MPYSFQFTRRPTFLLPSPRRRHLFPFTAALLLLLTLTLSAHAQRSGDFGLTYTQERSKFVGASDTNFFYLRGASADLSFNLAKGLGISVTGTGLAASNLKSTIDIQQVSFLVGPRYTYNLGRITPTAWGRRGGIFAEGKVGYTFATNGIYPGTGITSNHASALTYTGGGGLNLHIYHRLDLRLIEADFVRTQLPNGSTNVQNTLRLASGINFHIGN